MKYEQIEKVKNSLLEDIKSVKNSDELNDLKVENPTIIKVKNHKVVESIEGKENILNFFESK